MTTSQGKPVIGTLLRHWRQRRHLSQLSLALETEISTRHLSFLETGRAEPSREMVLRLARQLNVPLRERNAMLIAAGFAPVFPERALQDPELQSARDAIDTLLRAHEPYPCLAMDRGWNIVAANSALAPLLTAVSPRLLEPPINVLRLSLHPDGLKNRIVNLNQWRGHLIERLRREIDLTADVALVALLDEVNECTDHKASEVERVQRGALVVPLELESDLGTLSFISATTVFGTAVEVTLSEITLETFFPANAETADALHRQATLRSAISSEPMMTTAVLKG
jgi:transcriptional regulator with XRE-family HTH domain